MPLTNEEIVEVINSYNLLDIEKVNKLNRSQIVSLFQDLKIPLTDQQKDVIINGMLACNQKATLNNCINIISCLHDHDDLGILKICFRGIDQRRTRKVNLDQAVEISQVIGKPMTKEDLSKSIPSNISKEFTFSDLSKLILGINIPENADPFNGIEDRSACCYIC
ncbi:hypothetical protein TVAG_249890 [Trichomonas vaginalis G3]|uniref:EF hand family protein n=1 Tax=Trichomonas vaginalis (strain ATCC PRA-98 / G3) TaxID=412133 RepID=A2DCJ2_TRIV3|nr:EF-hand family [Trichomonas vaginalis G3]EAY21929.1 hypothetical protein TVAG_249890 [Trichomonas vaginalis G3]KAI5487596.1 EF-hand family [Trichomonas vaginalis G3]|eukprot:XP_001582915.1 hypothetical protein [Trichomonas vaginalis G3]